MPIGRKKAQPKEDKKDKKGSKKVKQLKSSKKKVVNSYKLSTNI
jgi:hypothetical protein